MMKIKVMLIYGMAEYWSEKICCTNRNHEHLQIYQVLANIKYSEHRLAQTMVIKMDIKIPHVYWDPGSNEACQSVCFSVHLSANFYLVCNFWFMCGIVSVYVWNADSLAQALLDDIDLDLVTSVTLYDAFQTIMFHKHKMFRLTKGCYSYIISLYTENEHSVLTHIWRWFSDSKS